MEYIKRDIEKKILSLSEEYSVLIVTGPRQVGKTTMLRNLSDDERGYVTLDDLEDRRLAKNDPAMFIKLHPAPVMIDEVQYAPELFSYIKIEADNGAAPGSYWLTGSQSFGMMRLARESLAGRAAVLHMSSLSQHEMFGSGISSPFTVDLDSLMRRKDINKKTDLFGIYERIWNGSMPGLAGGRYKDRDVFYRSYLETYIDRDVSEMISSVDKLVFIDFIRAAACRAGQMLNVHDIAMDVDVSDDTARRWLQVLEKSEIIFYLRPYSNNLLKRTVKTPKIYFFDTGLVAALTRYSSPEILMNGAINGAILENYIVSEIIKSYHNEAKDCLIWYYRDKNSKEIDMIIESDGYLNPIEIKRAVNPGSQLTKTFKVLDKGSVPRGKGCIICMRDELSAVDSDNFIVPVWMI